MDSAARTGDVVNTCLNLGLNEDACRVAKRADGGWQSERESEASVQELERADSEDDLKTLLLAMKRKILSLFDGFRERRSEALLKETQNDSPRKRKLEYNSDEECWKIPRESNRGRVRKVYYQVDASDMSLVVVDGYQWRKYGQKVTRDNPSPRAYFKCSFAPSCPVKKKVQRSVDDPTILVATYEGEHNHRFPSCAAAISSLPNSIGGRARSIHASPPTASSSITRKTETGALPNLMIQQIAESLTKDPAFTLVIAEAISGTVLSRMLAQTDRR